MRKSRFTETQIVSILQEHDAGATCVDLGRRHGVRPNRMPAWKSKYGGMESSEFARARAIDNENARVRRIIANLSLESDAMKELIAKKIVAPCSESRGEGVARTGFESARGLSARPLSAIGR